MSDRDAPEGLGVGGMELWSQVVAEHDLNVSQVVQLTEACRAKDRLDKLDLLLRGEVETWAKLTHRLQTADYELRIDDAAKLANATANQMKQMLAALRLPDEATGRKPQQRGAARGSYAPKAGKVSSMARAREAKAAGA